MAERGGIHAADAQKRCEARPAFFAVPGGIDRSLERGLIEVNYGALRISCDTLVTLCADWGRYKELT